MIETIGSIVLYVLVCACIIPLAKKAVRRKKGRSSLWMIILILTLVSGLRHQSVGIDTAGYVTNISRLQYGYLPKISNITEQGFLALSYILVNISDGYTLALIVYALSTNALVICRLYDYKERISFPWAVFIYYMLFYFTTFNTIRQWLAMAIVFWGTRYIGNNAKSIAKYVFYVILGIMFHSTAVLAIFFIPLYFFSVSSRRLKAQLGKIFMMLVMFVGAIFIYGMLEERYGATYLSASNNGAVSLVNIALLLFSVGLMLYDNKGRIVIRKGNQPEENNGNQGIKFETMAYFIGILLTLMVYFTRYADRVGQYFMLFQIVFLSYYIRKPRTRLITSTFVVLLCLYLRVNSFMVSGYGEMPYIPFWG